MAASHSPHFRWLRTCDEAFGVMLAAIAGARRSVRFEMYIFAESRLGDRFRTALIEARQRGAIVQVQLDAVGSFELPDDYWDALAAQGGEIRWFNPIQLTRFGIRDHRKLLVCDEATAIIGGFNVAPEYEGDGVSRGWRDCGLQIQGPLARDLSLAFDLMFGRAESRERPLVRLRKSRSRKSIRTPDGVVLLSGPGRGRNPLTATLKNDLKTAREVEIISAYFLPTWSLRHALTRVARRGGRVRLVLPGRSDVPIARLASHGLYQKMLNAGIEIYEYQPQILHTKLIIIDEMVYVGSANLDPRSLNINYELLVRLASPEVVAGARQIFAEHLEHSQQIHRTAWRKSRTFWNKLKEHWSHFLLARLDPYLAMKQLDFLR
jgi:cardiolipin synthase